LEQPDRSVVPRSIEILRGEFLDEVVIIGKIVILWPLASWVFWGERFLRMTLDEPDMAARCIDRLREIAITFGLSQIAYGGDALIVT
jgi:uroporphyrinogen-III decarboxylase